MTQPVYPPTPSTVGSIPLLIPPENAVHGRLVAVCREARLLRRLLKLCREAAAITPADHLPAPTDRREGFSRA